MVGDSGYLKSSTFETKTSFGMGTMGFENIHSEFIDLFPYDERYEHHPPGLRFHGLILGTPYLDIEGTSIVRNMKKPKENYCVTRF